MNNQTTNLTAQATNKGRLKKWQWHLLVSQVAIAAFIMYLALFANQELLLAGLCGVATLTIFVAFAAVFQAREAD